MSFGRMYQFEKDNDSYKEGLKEAKEYGKLPSQSQLDAALETAFSCGFHYGQKALIDAAKKIAQVELPSETNTKERLF